MVLSSAAPLDTIAASTWRWDGNNGSVLVSSGFPLKPGQVTSSNLGKVRVYVGDVEQAVAVVALRGTFADGSYRSIGIQFNYNLTNNTPVVSSVVMGNVVRQTTDISWTEPTSTTVRNKAVIAPTDPIHLCSTMVTLMPLTPATNDAGPMPAWNTELEDAWADTGVAAGTQSGTAIYDHVVGLFGYYCRTGTPSWYQDAWDWAIALVGDKGSDSHTLAYTLPSDPITSCTNYAIFDPESIVGNNGSCGGMAEAYSTRHLTLAVSYWMTAWRQPIRASNVYAENLLWKTTSGYTATRDYWISDTYGIRFNISSRGLFAVLAGYLVESTTSFTTPAGVSVTTFDYPTWLPWTIDALVDYTYDLVDYRDGLVGMRDTVTGEGTNPGDFPLFQLSLVANYLMAYYDHVLNDSRIPGLLKTMADFLITQSRASASSEAGYPDSWVTPYESTAPPLPGSGLLNYYIPEFAAIFAWVYASTGDSTYLTWLDRSIASANVTGLIEQTKIWGELWGRHLQCAGYYRNGGAIRALGGAPTTITAPPVHESLG